MQGSHPAVEDDVGALTGVLALEERLLVLGLRGNERAIHERPRREQMQRDADHDAEDREQPSTPADIPDDEPEEDVLEQRQEVPYREDDR